jgi:transaldolase
VLWASTGTKNPAYSDVKYVEPLIGPETINTMPLETLRAYRDHGRPAARLEHGVAEARRVLEQLPEVGIDLDAVMQQLEQEGIEKVNQPYDRLMAALEEKRTAAAGHRPRAAA